MSRGPAVPPPQILRTRAAGGTLARAPGWVLRVAVQAVNSAGVNSATASPNIR